MEPPSNHRLSTGPLQVPDHEMLKLIGRGAYGEVWLARNVMGTYRAIKVVSRDAFDHDRPYEREYEGIRHFEPISRSHDSQIDVLHVGRNESAFYYVMELADDSNLLATDSVPGELDVERYAPKTLKSELNRRGPLPVSECVEIALALTTALDHLHKSGLVHRDIKPSNIIYRHGLPKLADIGLVCAFDATRSYVGTIGFVAPEGPGSPQADVYSLGKVLYEAATARDRQDFPELPTHLSGTAKDQTALLELNEVLLKACEGDPHNRYQSAEEMHEDLLLLRSGQSLVRLRLAERRFKWARRTSVAAAVIALLGGLAYWNQVRQTHVVTTLAQEKSALADEKSRLVDEKSRLLEDSRQRLVRLNIANGIQKMDQRELSTALLWFAEALPLVANRPAEESIHRIRIQQTLEHQPRLLHVLPHPSSVLSGAFSPDRKTVATISQDELRIWDADSGRIVLGPIKGYDGVRSLRFTRDGTMLWLRPAADQFGPRSLKPGSKAFLVDVTNGLARLALTGIGRAALSPDDQWLAVERTNHLIELREARSGQVFRQLAGHSDSLSVLTFDATSALLLSGGKDGSLRVWRIPSGELECGPLLHKQPLERALFSPDSSRIASSCATNTIRGQTIRTWDVHSGLQISMAQRSVESTCLTFDTFNGRRLIVDGEDGKVEILDTETHKRLLAPIAVDTAPRCWCWSPGKVQLAIGTDGGIIRVWNTITGFPSTAKMLHAGWVESVDFDSEGTRLLSTSDDATAKIWDLAAGEARPGMRLDRSSIFSDAEPLFIPLIYAHNVTGRRLILGGGLDLRIIDTGKLAFARPLLELKVPGLANAVAINAQGDQWAAAAGPLGSDNWNGAILWHYDGDQVREFQLQHPDVVQFLEFSRDSSELFTLSKESVLRRWRTSDGLLLNERKFPEIQSTGSELPMRFARLSPDHSSAAVWFMGDAAGILHLNETPIAMTPLPAEVRTLGAAFSPDGNRLFTVGRDQRCHLWDVRTGNELIAPRKHGGGVGWVEWSPDGTQFLSVGLIGAAKIWNSTDGTPLLPAVALGESMRVAHFSPDGRFIVARGSGRRARVWDRFTRDAITPEIEHNGEVWAAFIAGRNRLITISGLQYVQAWDLEETKLSPTTVVEYAQFLSGSKLNSDGFVQPLTPVELAETEKSLRQSEPQLFATNLTQVADYHYARVLEPGSLFELSAASFHLDRLVALNPRNSAIPDLKRSLAAWSIPPRSRDLPPELINLSCYYNASLGLSWHTAFSGHDLSEVPRGQQILDGARFDVRGVIQISASEPEVGQRVTYPAAVSGIVIGLTAKRLHFLHATQGESAQQGDRVGSYVVHYANGSTTDIPLIYGQDLRDWFTNSEEPEETAHARIAWKGENENSRLLKRSLHLYHLAWNNPTPSEQISSIDFRCVKSVANPFLIALTADLSE